MSLPADYNTGRVTGHWVDLLGAVAVGMVTFTARATRLISDATQTIVIGRPITVDLDADGKISVDLPATDDPDILPMGFTYLVTEILGTYSKSYELDVPVGSTTDLSRVVPPSTSPGEVIVRTTRYDGLVDVDATGAHAPSAGQVPVWDATASLWRPGTPAASGGGATGPAGPAGPAGATGAASTVPGPAGPIGATGPAGATGAASTVPGPAGATGPIGPIGATGAAGTNGTNGATGPSGVVTATAPATYNSGTQTIGVALGTTATTAAAGNDTRLSDARTPTAHATSHAPAGTDDLTTALSAATAPVALAATAAAGAGTGFARQGHVHPTTGLVTTSLATAKGDLLIATASGVIARHGVGTDGQVLTADSTQVDGAKWATPAAGGGASHLTRKTGRYYATGASGGNTTFVKDTMYLVPWWTDVALTITRLGFYLATAGGSGAVVRLGLYGVDSGGEPTGTPLVDGGTIAADGTFDIEKELIVSTAIPVGPVVIAFAWQVGTPASVFANNANGTYYSNIIGSPTLDLYYYPAAAWTQTGVTGALPTIALTGRSTTAPRLTLKG
jgi:hypothetical protein